MKEKQYVIRYWTWNGQDYDYHRYKCASLKDAKRLWKTIKPSEDVPKFTLYEDDELIMVKEL